MTARCCAGKAAMSPRTTSRTSLLSNASSGHAAGNVRQCRGYGSSGPWNHSGSTVGASAWASASASGARLLNGNERPSCAARRFAALTTMR